MRDLKQILCAYLAAVASGEQCCRYVRLEATNQLAHPLSAIFERGENGVYQRVNQYGEIDPTRVFASHTTLNKPTTRMGPVGPSRGIAK